MVSVVSSNPTGGTFLKFFKPLNVNFGLKCKCDLIVKNSSKLLRYSILVQKVRWLSIDSRYCYNFLVKLKLWDCVDGSNPNACERSLVSHAVYMLIQCTPLLVEKAGVTPVVTFRITARKQGRVQARYPLWIWNPWGRTHEFQNRSNQWLHKVDLGPNKNFKRKS